MKQRNVSDDVTLFVSWPPMPEPTPLPPTRPPTPPGWPDPEEQRETEVDLIEPDSPLDSESSL